jgi:hypothetical protein
MISGLSVHIDNSNDYGGIDKNSKEYYNKFGIIKKENLINKLNN